LTTNHVIINLKLLLSLAQALGTLKLFLSSKARPVRAVIAGAAATSMCNADTILPSQKQEQGQLQTRKTCLDNVAAGAGS